MEEELVFVKNQRGNDALLHNGYRYNKTKKVNQDKSVLWRCTNKRECSASVTLNETENQIMRQSEHTCQADYDKNAVYLEMCTLKELVCTNLEPIKGMFENKFDNLAFEPSTSKASIPTFHEKKDCLYRARKNFLRADHLIFQDLAQVSIPEALSDDFLVADDGESDKILVFASNISIRFLRRARRKRNRRYFADGTFKSVPKPFYQLFTLHVDLCSDSKSTQIVPVVYALLPNKNQDTYLRLFNIMKSVLKINITNFKCDYELGIMNAVKTVYPDAQITGCYFHYQKAIWKKAKELNLTNRKETRQIIRKIAILPLLPAENIPEGCQKLTEIIENESLLPLFETFLKYFAKQWYPRMNPSLLSCSGQRHRTTNALEGWHHRINVKIPKRPSLFLFLQKLRKEAKHFDSKLKNSQFQTKKKRYNKYIHFDKKYKKVLTKLKNGQITVITFLKKMTYYQLLL
ncbi:hypothetical protein ABMA27_007788 [Loxostege sticticalis]|uniref:MULE transposase domain-containing protein n=1 Tax=Loxostege sticticalis TaxID=481309 RepID=A0ABR3HDD9_LOXSC